MIAYASRYGIALSDVFCLLFFYVLTVLTITAGYHRYYTHRAYECSRVVQFFYLVIGAFSMENPVLNWASNHRYHHQFEDTDRDPYNIRRGFFWAHFKWMFYQDPPNRPFANVPDLKKDSLVQWQFRNYWPLVILGVIVVPTLLGACFGRPLGGLLWGGFLRMVVVHHVTFMINSAAHTFGRKTHSAEATARDSLWLAVLALGEGYHSYHHAYPADYRIGVRAHHFDPGKWFISALERAGLARKLRRSTPRAASPIPSAGPAALAPTVSARPTFD